MTAETFKLVTAIVFDEDGENDSASVLVTKDTDLESAKRFALDLATGRFDDNFCRVPRGIVYHIDHVKVPELPQVTIESTPEIIDEGIEVKKL
jgi:hypothetical protein